MDHLAGLNERQREAALHKEGPLLIVAGAGAGKTKTITHRIINLITEGVPPEQILAVTFTNKAAKEMRERVEEGIKKYVPGQDSLPFVSTFHSLGVYMIKENARLLGLSRYFTILDDNDTTTLIKEAEKELDLDPKQYDPRRIKNIISRQKGEFVNSAEYSEKEEGGRNPLNKIVASVWDLYEKKKARENSLDFDDLLLKTARLLRDKPEIRLYYQEKWKYIHVDEYQDTNEVQYLLSKLLAEQNHNICVVGDADQNIYSWRGANLKNILHFEKDYPEAKIILLEQNYRSTKNILEAANTIIKKNIYRPDKNLFTDNTKGEKIGLYEALDEMDEADFIASKVLELADQEKSSFSQIAVLYRANFQSRALEEAMLRHSIPYQVLGVKFFERKEIKDTLAYLRAALNPDSLSDIKRIINFPARGIGKVTLLKIFAGQAATLPVKTRLKLDNFHKILSEISEKIKTEKPSSVIKFAVKRSGIEAELSAGSDEELERLENIKELATLALKYDALPGGAGIEKLLEDAALSSDQDSLLVSEGKKEIQNAVKLMTVHASKGLEFDYVFIAGLEDGLFPHERQHEAEKSEDREEERRLFYVALTRARRKLYLSFANFRTIFGSRNINAPSEFVHDIPPDLLEKEGEDGRIKTIYI